MDPRQQELLQQMLAIRQAASMRDPSLRRNVAPGMGSAANAGGQVQGLLGAPAGPDPNPFSQVPGGGSTANAVPQENPMVEDRRYYTDMADDGFANSMLGYGVGGAALMTPPNALSLLTALGGMGYGAINGFRQSHGERNAKRLGFQGN